MISINYLSNYRKTFILLVISLFIIITNLLTTHNNFIRNNQLNFNLLVSKIYIIEIAPVILRTITYLLFVLIIIVNLVKMKEGALRQNC